MGSPVRKVCLVGASGTVGSAILSELLAARCFIVSVLRRSTSSSVPRQTEAIASILSVSPAFDTDELSQALVGQDAVVAAFPVSDVGQHLRLAEAAARAGVLRFIPADFGSCDASNSFAQECAQLYRDKMRIRGYCGELAARSATFSWTSLVCGHLFDKDLYEGYLRFHLDTCSAEIFDGGHDRASSSTLRRIGQAVVSVLRDHLEETCNRTLFIQSFNPTQAEILAALEQATSKTWRTKHIDSDVFLERQRRRFEEGNEDALEEIVFVLGTRDADWSHKDSFANRLLGLENENLDNVVSQVVAKHARAGKEPPRD
ncbi:hypothetical protein JDV02_008919 [Purpureocillium takamizusanense]|uniref:NmrA-like domain-containing protein n=1 Tax=Purpureocillium takamizusanense TaxID=2060973 RepID=A0A9Q8QL35_9HYPO|nr:uncharacterized protein JDV02_008919 [Purpureocillium takamizusanense]UNI23079.1 hypothetical protein JDV02_008919 [Purpureocillium takamizusanense]